MERSCTARSPSCSHENAMTPQDWERAKDLFADALEREGADRALFIQQICDRDGTTGREVKRLIAEHEQSEGFLEHGASPLSKLAGIFEQENGDDTAGDPYAGAPSQRRIGPYAILQEIGHGGMGTV